MDDETREHLNRESAKHHEQYKGLPGADHSLHYDRQGNPIGLGDWCALRETEDREPNLDYIVVARTGFNSGIEVSTVWLGIDHSFGMGGPPIIFETMVFRSEITTIETPWGVEDIHRSVGLDIDDPDDWRFQQRYSTEEEALAGHKGVCEELERRGHKPVRAGA